MECTYIIRLIFDRPISAAKQQAMQDFLAMLLERELAPRIEQCGEELCDYAVDPFVPE